MVFLTRIWLTSTAGNFILILTCVLFKLPKQIFYKHGNFSTYLTTTPPTPPTKLLKVGYSDQTMFRYEKSNG